MDADLVEQVLRVKQTLEPSPPPPRGGALVVGMAVTLKLVARGFRASMTNDTGRIHELGDDCIAVAAALLNALETLSLDSGTRLSLRDPAELTRRLSAHEPDDTWAGDDDRRRAILNWIEALRAEIDAAETALRDERGQDSGVTETLRAIAQLLAMTRWAQQQ